MGGRSSISWRCGASKPCQTHRILCCGWGERDPAITCLRIYAEQKLRESSFQSGIPNSSLENQITDITGSSSRISLSAWRIGSSGYSLRHYPLTFLLFYTNTNKFFSCAKQNLLFKLPNILTRHQISSTYVLQLLGI